jgi:DNA-binding MarR family transcriptional regulator
VPRYKTAERIAGPEYQTLADFRHSLRRFLRFSEEEARAAGIETQQYQFMLAIKGLPEGTKPTIGELARRMLVQHHSAVGMVDRLEENGLVERVGDPDDRRVMLLRLTPIGEQMLRRLYETHARELRALAPELIRTLSDLLTGGAAVP